MTSERALQVALMDAFMGFRTSRAPRRSRPRVVEPHVVEPAPKSIKCAVAPIEKVVPVEPAPKVERKPRLAQAFPGVPQRGRGAGRRFTKVTAVGAAVARAQHLTPERRREIALAASAARWGRA